MNKVGIIGFGNMGSAIAQRLIQNNFDVYGWNRTAEKMNKVRGVTALSSINEVVTKTDVILVIVSDDNALEEVLTMHNGILSVNGNNGTIVNISTITPQMSLKAFKLLNTKGFEYVESPVLGGPTAALSGNLIALNAGSIESINKVKNIIQSFSRDIFYLGDIPKASAAKLIFNSMLFTAVEVLGEGIQMADGWGLSPSIVKEIGLKTWLKPLFENYLERGLSKDAPVGFALELAAKDFNYALDMARKNNSFTPAIAGAYQAFLAAAKAGFAKKDYASVIKFLYGK